MTYAANHLLASRLLESASPEIFSAPVARRNHYHLPLPAHPNDSRRKGLPEVVKWHAS